MSVWRFSSCWETSSTLSTSCTTWQPSLLPSSFLWWVPAFICRCFFCFCLPHPHLPPAPMPIDTFAGRGGVLKLPCPAICLTMCLVDFVQKMCHKRYHLQPNLIWWCLVQSLGWSLQGQGHSEGLLLFFNLDVHLNKLKEEGAVCVCLCVCVCVCVHVHMCVCMYWWVGL